MGPIPFTSLTTLNSFQYRKCILDQVLESRANFVTDNSMRLPYLNHDCFRIFRQVIVLPLQYTQEGIDLSQIFLPFRADSLSRKYLL